MNSSLCLRLALVVAMLTSVAAVPPQEATLGPRAAAYLARALGTAQSNYYLADEVDWQGLYRRAFDAAAGAQAPSDTYAALRQAFGELSHTFVQFSAAALDAEADGREARGLPDWREPEATANVGTRSPFAERREPAVASLNFADMRLGHVIIPSFGGSPAASTRFAQTLQHQVRAVEESGVCGWVVDLRGNGGGNMWPMLVGVGPVLGEGVVGSFEVGGKPAGNWFYRDGVSGTEGENGFVGARLAGPAYRLETAPPVAVLIDGGTGSSGEALAIAFKGRADTRFFGVPTAGYSTSTNGFRMDDGVNLVIAVGLDVDREGTAYPREVQPDVTVDYAAVDDLDAQMRAAATWLAEVCAR